MHTTPVPFITSASTGLHVPSSPSEGRAVLLLPEPPGIPLRMASLLSPHSSLSFPPFEGCTVVSRPKRDHLHCHTRILSPDLLVAVEDVLGSGQQQAFVCQHQAQLWVPGKTQRGSGTRLSLCSQVTRNSERVSIQQAHNGFRYSSVSTPQAARACDVIDDVPGKQVVPNAAHSDQPDP